MTARANLSPPPLSFILITHERYRLFWQAFDSVIKAKANYPGEIEIIVVNSSRKPLFNKTNNVEGITELFVPAEPTAPGKRNIGWHAAKNEWVVFMDDDCRLHAQALQYISQSVSTADQQTAAYFGVTEFQGPQKYWFSILEGTDFLEDYSWARDNEELIWAPTALGVFSKTAMAQVNGFDSGLIAGGEDVAICLELRQKGKKIRAIPKTLVYHDISTWNSLPLNLRRFFYYGVGEFYLQLKFPGHTHLDLQSPVFLLIPWFFMLFFAIIAGGLLIRVMITTVVYLLSILAANVICELLDTKRGVYRTLGIVLYRFAYRTGSIWSAIKQRCWRNLVSYWNFINDSQLTKYPKVGRNFYIKWSAVLTAVILAVSIMG
ncbi:MAG: glycosyltransferase family 2 protein [Candidatus Aminicenantes bacterium]|jgi:glycosyltransferase involved in cell wall biosynthesis